jgi:hypothetical protein
VCDRYQVLVLAVALWNGRDPILKERTFGLTPHESNHGEDAKEHWHYLDSTPTHSYMRLLYRYPQEPFPYAQLVEESRRRGADEPEYELLDTGVFDEDRYFDVVVEYGTAIQELAAAVRRNVTNAIEKMTGLEVTEINIRVDDIHLPDEDDGDGARGDTADAAPRVQ